MTEPEYEWYCEDCGRGQNDEPEDVVKYEGYGGEIIELWFCEDCETKRYTRF